MFLLMALISGSSYGFKFWFLVMDFGSDFMTYKTQRKTITKKLQLKTITKIHTNNKKQHN